MGGTFEGPRAVRTETQWKIILFLFVYSLLHLSINKRTCNVIWILHVTCTIRIAYDCFSSIILRSRAPALVQTHFSIFTQTVTADSSRQRRPWTLDSCAPDPVGPWTQPNCPPSKSLITWHHQYNSSKTTPLSPQTPFQNHTFLLFGGHLFLS